MTINNSYVPVLVDGDDATSDIDFTFKAYSTSDVVVIKRNKTSLAETTLVEGVDYTVALLDSTEGGTVTLSAVSDSGFEYYIGTDIPATQTATFPLGQALREDNIELMGDKLCRLIQQTQADIGSAVRFALQQEAPELPALSSGKYLTNDGSSLSWNTPTNTDYAGTISYGLDANKPTSPGIGDVYIATDTLRVYVCSTNGSWGYSRRVNDLTVDDDLSVSGTASLGSLNLATGATVTEISIDGTFAGNSDSAVPTEKAVKTYVDTNTTLSAQKVKAWVNFQADGTINDHYNIASVVKNGTGDYTVTFTNAFANDDYAVASCIANATLIIRVGVTQTTSAIQIIVVDTSASPSDSGGSRYLIFVGD